MTWRHTPRRRCRARRRRWRPGRRTGRSLTQPLERPSTRCVLGHVGRAGRRTGVARARAGGRAAPVRLASFDAHEDQGSLSASVRFEERESGASSLCCWRRPGGTAHGETVCAGWPCRS
ncbi:MAG: hypothetical protein MZV65_01650 [Chromatiales bacterium]|nr:hypothetical protein [Chromatiales bacterium]